LCCASSTFAWGWASSLVIYLCALGGVTLAAPSLHFLTPLSEFVTHVAVGSAVWAAIAFGVRRNLRLRLLAHLREADAVAKLAASREAYRDLAENAHHFIWEADQLGRFTYLNDAVARFTGMPKSALLGQSARSLLIDDPRNPDLESLLARRRAGEEVPPQIFRMKSGEGPRWVEAVAQAVRGSDGQLIGVRGIAYDVTERVLAEQRLRESEERYRGLVESQLELIARVDPEGRVTFVNDAFCAKFGRRREELIGMRFDGVLASDDLTAARAAIARSGTPPNREALEIRHRTADGWRWIAWEGSAICDAEGRTIEIQAAGRDVTERRAAEDALRASLEELGRSEEQIRLLAQRQASIREEERMRLGFDLHDGVCQELVGIGILIEAARLRLVARTGEPVPELERIVPYITTLTEHLRKLASELRPMLLSDLGLADSLRSLAGRASNDVSIVVQAPAQVPRVSEAAELAVYRIAQEALANALRHAGARHIELTLGAQNGTLRVAVQDDGRGFDPAACRSQSLGIESMKQRALALGGRLELVSAPGKGTTVLLEYLVP
jgi:PAS domain S-box-containing protein